MSMNVYWFEFNECVGNIEMMGNLEQANYSVEDFPKHSHGRLSVVAICMCRS